MCGIAGLFHEDGRPPDRALVETMAAALVHRGPDDQGFHVEPGVALGFRRLSIIDLAGGHQPMFNEDGTVAVIFNGEIYNFRELRATLAEAGHRFATRADTEVLVHGWEEWGSGLVNRLRGMFAFAVWDRRGRRLFLARDRLGIKPLYYARLGAGRWAFASEMKALLALADLRRRLDPLAVVDYLSLGYVPDPRTILQDARKLPPGCTLTLETRATAEPSRYWEPRFPPLPGEFDAGRGEEDLLARLDDAVGSHLEADVPLGAFLSGGIDSSAVVSSMARLGDGPVQTCAIAFGEEGYDEARFARMVAERFGAEHRERRAEPDHFALVDTLVATYDEPFADPSALPTYLLCGLARERVKVALSGDGGDETLAGYHRYRHFLQAEQVHRLLPRAVRRPLTAGLGAMLQLPVLGEAAWRRGATLRSLGGDLVLAYARLIAVSDADTREALLSPALRSELQGYRTEVMLREVYRSAPAEDPLSRIQCLDLATYLPGDILTKVDRASMAHSLEVRVPLLDHRWIEWAATVPPGWRLRRGKGKHLFREALRRRLPEAVLDRPKHGFSVPVARWLRGPLRETMRSRLLGRALGETGVVDPAAVRGLVEAHLGGGRDHGAILWALLMLTAWWEARIRGSR